MAATGPVSTDGLPPGTFRNPIFNHDAADPSVIKGADGAYYLYTTQSDYARHVNIPVLRSLDLVHWQYVGDALPSLPPWAGSQSWAPQIDRAGNGYRLYFATQIAGTENFGIAVAVSQSPLGPFVNSAHPVVTGQGLTALDPYVLDLPGGRRVLYWGSWGSPLEAAALSRNGLSLAETPRPLLFPDPSGGTPYERLIEAPWILVHGGEYYLMYSGDRCCSSNAHYAVMVARSSSPYGPFVRDPNNPILAGNAAFNAPGHNATITDAIGQDWIVYHAMRPRDSGDRVLMMDRIDWTPDGWPTINGGSGPSGTPVAAPIIS